MHQQHESMKKNMQVQRVACAKAVESEKVRSKKHQTAVETSLRQAQEDHQLMKLKVGDAAAHCLPFLYMIRREQAQRHVPCIDDDAMHANCMSSCWSKGLAHTDGSLDDKFMRYGRRLYED